MRISGERVALVVLIVVVNKLDVISGLFYVFDAPSAVLFSLVEIGLFSLYVFVFIYAAGWLYDKVRSRFAK